MKRGGLTYITTNKNNTTLYTGSAEDVTSRMIEHKEKYYPRSFTARYNLDKLVFYRNFSPIEEAREYERYIKGKTRQWKVDLINSTNPDWRDLTDELL